MSRPFIGQMRRRLTIQSAVDVADGAGGVQRRFQDVGGLWAQIRPLSVTSRITPAGEQALVTHLIIYRERSMVTAGMRFVIGNRIFNIRAIEPYDDLSSFVRALCQEIRP